jgi:hypothetical protein
MSCTTLLACDGTVSAPGMTFNSETNLGFYRISTNQIGVSVGTNGLGMEIGNFSITNIIPNPYGPNTVRYTSSIFTQPLGGDLESTGLYIKMNHATSQMVYGIYGEIDASQNGVGGSFTKVNHLGAGDAHYVAHFGTGGIGYESASWANNTTGFLADVQIAGLSNAIMFNALWEQATIPNYGLFVATAVPANALTISKFSDGYEGNVQIRITEPNYGYDRFEVFNSGQVNQIGVNANSTVTLSNAPEHRLVASYWNGTATVQQHAVIGHAMDSTTPSSHMYFKVGPYGSEQYAAILSPGLLDLQGATIANCNSIQSTAATTIVANGHVVAQFSYDSVDATGALALNIVSTNVATAGSATLPSNPLGFMIVNLNGANVKVPYYAV